MDLGLKDKVYIVTGGSEGIGGGISEAIAQEGGIPVIASWSGETTKDFVSKLRNQGSKADYILGDLQSTDYCKDVVDFTIHRYGKIDGIINNAGSNDGASLEKGPEAFRKSLLLNLNHYFDLVHFALPYLKENQGSILNISSKVALTGQGGTSGYAAAKGAHLALTREWALELAPYGIRVNAIVPAEVMTPYYKKWLKVTFDNPEEKEKQISSKVPFGSRMTKIEEIASLAVFLISHKSNHTTGQFLHVDGGYVHLDRAIT
ncbi:SDR family oxidoreductase [Belliella kenyensis]|uniref:SDR family oxidoreductase n=1 Tax=Belliella kenyensis TaxID=1472724 RepID=A0ABV8ELT5_9BACT|nr:SDR family oxidoreductase [Belliella kenyensis]MCH7401354.1 SDR family oxidoreductase [Belliella kenyensis]MDN3602797.1 SDR family oxidoreductase [Belliella kenyensis]